MGHHRTPYPAMADPVIVDVVGDGMLLRGTILHMVDNRTYEHEQMWLLRPAAEDGPPLPAFDARPWIKQLPQP